MSRSQSHRGGQGLTNWPASRKPELYGTSSESSSLSPAADGICDAIVSQEPNPTGIGGLNSASGPPTIARLVMAVVIDAIKRMLVRGFWPHICQEVYKRINPSLADRDSTAAVVGVLRSMLVQAPALHRSPRTIFSRVRSSVCRSWGLARSAKAPAGDDLLERQLSHTEEPTFSAVALAEPFVTREVIRHNRQASDSQAGKLSHLPDYMSAIGTAHM